MSLATVISKIIPAVTGVFGKLFGKTDESVRTAELHAQVVLTEAQAFEQGRVAPRYFFQYILAVVFFAAAILLLIDVAWPDLLPGAPAAQMCEILSQCADFFVSIFGE